jgi:hypothetical protein
MRFIKSIYATGGEFCLRGYYSKEFFDKLGFHDAVVTGCPSLFQRGKDLKVEYEKITKDQLKPALNGDFELCKKPLKDYYSGAYFDQGKFYPVLYREYTGGVFSSFAPTEYKVLN